MYRILFLEHTIKVYNIPVSLDSVIFYPFHVIILLFAIEKFTLLFMPQIPSYTIHICTSTYYVTIRMYDYAYTISNCVYTEFFLVLFLNGIHINSSVGVEYTYTKTNIIHDHDKENVGSLTNVFII